MAEFLTQQRLFDKIENIIFYAKSNLFIMSPYIKLDEYFKKLFFNHSKNPDVHIVIVFGKNEDARGKSLNRDDFEFFKQFPKISILYLKDLHAKYYANESEGVVTSINLYDYSFKHNIEFGVHSKNPSQNILGLTTIRNPLADSLDTDAWHGAIEFMHLAEAVFIKRPVIQRKMFGLSTNYVGSEVLYDNTDFFTAWGRKTVPSKKTFVDFPDTVPFGKPVLEAKPTREEVESSGSFVKPNSYKPGKKDNQSYNRFTAYCIRTGERIKYNLDFPFTDSAYQSWKQWKNDDYEESFCHSCGEPCPSSKRKPLCDSCFYH